MIKRGKEDNVNSELSHEKSTDINNRVVCPSDNNDRCMQ